MATSAEQDLKTAQKQAAADVTRLKAIENRTAAENNSLRVAERNLKLTERNLKAEQARNKEFTSFVKSYTRLGEEIKNQLKGNSNSASVYFNLGKNISKEKGIQAKYADSEKESEKQLYANSLIRESVYGDITSQLEQQAKATQKAQDDLSGVNDIQRKIRDIEQSRGIYSAIQKRELIQALRLTEELQKKEERLLQIKEAQSSMYESLPTPVKQSVDLAKKLGKAIMAGAGPIAIIAAVVVATLASFTKLDEAAEDFRKETGLTNSQMGEMKAQTNDLVAKYGKFGVEAENVFKTLTAIKTELGDTVQYSEAAVGAMTVLGTSFGVSADNSAKVQSILESTAGLSQDTAASVQLQVANMSKLAGVAPAKVFADIAENAEAASTFFKGDLTALTKNAIEARRLGTSLKEQVSLAEKLLDFEGNIEEELKAATFVGGQFNLSRARALAMEGKLAEAQSETLSQVQRSGDFRKKDYFTQQQLAKAAGMSVEQINKQLNAQEKLNKLTPLQKKAAQDAIDKGLDITNIQEDQLQNEVAKYAAQQEQAGQLKELQNAFMGIAATVGSVLTPLLQAIAPIAAAIATPFQWMADGLKVINDNLALALIFYGGLAAYSGTILFNKLKEQILDKAALITGKEKAALSMKEAITSIFSSLGKIPFGVGLLLAGGAVAAMIGLMSKAGDMNSPADGKTQVSTKEGGLFELSPNDDLVAAPGAAAALSGKGSVGAQPVATTQINLSALSAPLNAMIAEIKALRADMASGKIAVHMDGAKVTAGISNQVDKSTRNNFALS